jgi:hypothetical protein
MCAQTRDPEYDPDELHDMDPTGEKAFAETGFQDGPDGGPILEAPGLEGHDPPPPDRGGQKVAGVPEEDQKRPTTPSADRPDTPLGVIRERGGAMKGDPAVGGTRHD